ncbi:MAG TPA: DUF6328 family protein [Gemmatimonadales bacterium]|nr:DUF6328 family protein [Gemmatimonadales bacterium]
MSARADTREHEAKLTLKEAAEYLLEECRMVLPGIQALFGFQLVAVFDSAFSQDLSLSRQRLHLVAVGLVACAVAMIMAPAAFHRQTGADRVTSTFVRVSTRLLLWSMAPLAAAICLDFYILASIIAPRGIAVFCPIVLAAVYVFFWFVLPRSQRLARLIAGRDQG